jgi:AraC family transcriptional regulator, regulatory protein of adaptative response / methylated-DNA-[protein]-cysteine methyltransferase
MPSDYQRIEQAIGYLTCHFRKQPRREEIAAAVGLSEHHFQRLFSRWAGVSPKRFLQLVRLDFLSVPFPFPLALSALSVDQTASD